MRSYPKMRLFYNKNNLIVNQLSNHEKWLAVNITFSQISETSNLGKKGFF